jgi:hypothetical protein
MAPVFRLGLNNANGSFIDKKGIINRSNIGLIFANGNTETRAEIDFLGRLHHPARFPKQGINFVTGNLLRVLIQFVHSVLRPLPSSRNTPYW